jgi:broad specificity phosphatase PhoE
VSEPRRRERRVVFWRHGQTQWNVEQRFQGHTDIALNETGVAQAARAAALLASLRPSMIVSSHLRRALDTAGELASLTGLEVMVDKDLRERGGGEWEGLTRAEIRAGWPVEFAEWEAPGGEPVTRSPSTRMVPPWMGSRPLMQRKSVLLPEPLRPMIATISPSATCSETC